MTECEGKEISDIFLDPLDSARLLTKVKDSDFQEMKEGDSYRD